MAMKFLSIYKTAERNTGPTQAEMERMGKLIEEGFKSGKLVATEGCMPSKLGARIRQANGQAAVTDGPFTEAKEIVGGFAIINVASREEAIEYVKEFMRIAGDGECEIRQLYEMPADTCAKAAN
jgi:hypothetical protein